MKISEKNLFLRLYVKAHDAEPDNFCALFWFSFFVTVIAPTGALVAILGLAVMLFHAPWVLLLMVPIVIMVYGIIFLLVKFVRIPRLAVFGERAADKIEDIVAVVKNKYCPRLQIVRKPQQPVTV